MTRPDRQRVVVVLAFLAFVSLGLPDSVAGVAWPSIRHQFQLPIDRLGELLACGVVGYLVSSTFTARIVRTVGVGHLLTGSTALVAAGLAGYAVSPTWGMMLPLATVIGLGSGAIDTALNAVAAVRFSPRITSWLHACYGLGATLGPLLMTFATTTPALGWRMGYGLLSGVLGGMALMFLATPRLWAMPAVRPTGEHLDQPADAPASLLATLRRPIVLSHILLFFVYAGTEVTTGQWLFSLLTESRQVDKRVAGMIVGLFWASLTAGRVVFGQWASKTSPDRLLRLGLLLAPAGAALIWTPLHVATAAGGAALLGFALAPIYPLLIAVTPRRVGERDAMQTIGFEVSAATVGIAALPALAGVLARRFGLEVIGPFLVAITLTLLALHEAVIRRSETPVAQSPVHA
jgi:fucose permease